MITLKAVSSIVYDFTVGDRQFFNFKLVEEWEDFQKYKNDKESWMILHPKIIPTLPDLLPLPFFRSGDQVIAEKEMYLIKASHDILSVIEEGTGKKISK